jgi:cell wall-associated NlpC family hydrolase
MTDRRRHFANARIAPLSMAGQVEAENYAQPAQMQVASSMADLCAAPNGPRDRQLPKGTFVQVLEDRDGWNFLQSDRDAYVGYVRSDALDLPRDATHLVAAPATHLYTRADFKSADLGRLSFGSRIVVLDERAKFFETPDGYIPKQHLRPLERPFSDPVTVAQLHFGAPYLWGGNAIWGIDCSGLVQAALLACGQECPGDSDMQSNELGTELPEDADLKRGDLIFWKGHVGMMVDPDTIIHANAHHMATAYEPISTAIRRIEVQGDGPVLQRRRL